MILKIKMKTGQDDWRFISKIDQAEVKDYKVSTGDLKLTRIITLFKDNEDKEEVYIPDDVKVYLLNDEGKTIERLN